MSVGAMVADAWVQAMRSMGPPVFEMPLWWWASAYRERINARGQSTRQIFGLLTPTELSDDQLLERM